MSLQDLGHGISAVDTGFQRPFFDASYLIVEKARAAFVDVGTSFSAPRLVAALESKGLSREDVDYVILTHVHLDHAGGAGEMMRRLPRARLVVHPRGARHMIDPAKLWAGATAVYGAAVMERDYGTMVPVEADRVVEAPDGHRMELAGRPLLLLDTPGHARHHLCVWDEASRGVFTGDTFGLSYPELASARGAFVLPTTTPVQFEPEAFDASIERLLLLQPEAVYLTHYSRVEEVDRLGADLRSRIAALAALARTEDGKPDRAARLRAGIEGLFLGWAREHGIARSDAEVRELLALDIELDAQGLEAWLDRERR